MRQTKLKLSDEDRVIIDEIRSKGVHHSREINRAHILSSLDKGIPESHIMEVLKIGRSTLWRIRLAYLQGGVELAIFDVAHTGRPVLYNTDAQAQVTALACSSPPKGAQRWTMAGLERAARKETGLGNISKETVRRMLKKNNLKPWRKVMWCIGTLNKEYRERMYNLLDLYAKPLCPKEPVICVDEKSLQLIGHSREPLPMAPHAPAKEDYEYTRNAMTNLFVAVEPKAGQRTVSVTQRRTKVDFVAFISEILTGVHAKARRIHLVLDNLNTHFRKCFEDVLGKPGANKLLRRVVFHYTPKHASWLNMAEIEIGTLSRQCLDRRIPNKEILETEVNAWQTDRNALKRCIEWKFTRQDADLKLAHRYVS